MNSLKRALKRAKLSLGLARPYQSKRSGGAQERWELIRPELDERDRSILDIGSNLGVLTELAAADRRFAVGIEPDSRLLGMARRRTARSSMLGFLRGTIDPDTVLALPVFDVVFCLSVHHYWVALYGENAAWRIIGELMARSRHKFFFEPASVKRKYGRADLDFEDLDRDTIVEYNVKHLESVAAPDQSIRILGETQCRPREPFRMLMLAERRSPQPSQ